MNGPTEQLEEGPGLTTTGTDPYEMRRKSKVFALRRQIFTRRRVQAWKQNLVILTTVSSDILLALLVWAGAYLLQSLWGRGPLLPTTIVAVAPAVAVWVGLRCLMGLYPGYGLGSVERLRRHTYSVFATLAFLAVFAVVSHVDIVSLSRLLLALG